MEWFSDIKDKFSKRRIRNQDRSKEFARDFVDLDSARKVGVIVNVTLAVEDELQHIQAYTTALKKRKKEILIIEINLNKKAEPSLVAWGDSHIFVDPTRLNWLDYPAPAVEAQIRQFEMDVLIDFDNTERPTSRYICSMAHARTRTGLHREGFESCYELMVHQDEGDESGMKGMIKMFDYFLNMIDNGKRVKANA
ncbi:MAG: hypothetical protein SF053_21120 [Bacteroidia bacterium]|jgi:aminopeptidase C|nr:hypothetical protein [Bacteroidia bacterium]